MRKTPSTETPVADSRPGLDPEVPTPRTRICTPEVSPCVFETSRLGAIEVSRFTSLIPDRAICSGALVDPATGTDNVLCDRDRKSVGEGKTVSGRVNRGVSRLIHK